MNKLSELKRIYHRGALATSVGTPSDGEDDQALRRAISAQAQLRVSQACELCGTASSAFDLVGS